MFAEHGGSGSVKRRPMRVRSLAMLIAATLLSGALPAAADHGGIHPQFATRSVFFHCGGAGSQLANPYSVEGKVPLWSPMPPSASVVDGAGCASQDPPVTTTAQVNPLDGVWRGTFGGNVKALTVRVYAFPRIVPEGDVTVGVRLIVDGVSQFGGTAAAPATKTITVQPQLTNADVTSYVEFSIVNLPFGTEDGVGAQNRQFTLSLLNETTDVQWVYDTTEVPSGILFNPPVVGPFISAGV